MLAGFRPNGKAKIFTTNCDIHIFPFGMWYLSQFFTANMFCSEQQTEVKIMTHLLGLRVSPEVFRYIKQSGTRYILQILALVYHYMYIYIHIDRERERYTWVYICRNRTNHVVKTFVGFEHWMQHLWVLPWRRRVRNE